MTHIDTHLNLMKKAILILSMIYISGCATVSEIRETTSCRIDCRAEGKEMDPSKSTCSCVKKATAAQAPELTKLDALMVQITILKQKVEELKPVPLACPDPTKTVPLLAPKQPGVKSDDPLRDLLND